MTTSNLSLWQVAPPGSADGGPGTGVVFLTSPRPPMSAGSVGVWFHEVMEQCDLRADKVDVWLPAYRSKSLVSLFSWLVTERLAVPGAAVAWRLEKRQGPDSIARMLAELGWSNLTKERAGRYTILTGEPPPTASLPESAGFTGRIGARDLTFSADYGVFSPRRIDDGTAWLAEVALSKPAVETLADIGVGYGALAIGLVLNGTAGNAVGTDIDSVALWLAERNARRYDLDLKVACTPNPLDAAPTPLTVCNMPTHIDATSSGVLMARLVQRARHGRVMVVVHQSLELRYARHLTKGGLIVDRYPGPTHVVLAARARRSS